MATAEKTLSKKSTSSWHATVSVTVTNQTGQNITNLIVTQLWNDITSGACSDQIANNDEIQFEAQTGSGHNDYWTVRFNIGDKIYYYYEKRCNIKQEDASSTGINLNLGETTFDIKMPFSGASNDNKYSVYNS
jgi:hypothetical protein